MVPLHLNVRQTWDSLERVLHFHDEPLHSMNALVGFELMRLARRHGTYVVLNGQGADETLAGYSSFHRAHWITQVLDGNVRQAMSDIREYAAAFGTDPRHHVRDVLQSVAFAGAGHLPGYRRLARMARRWLRTRDPWFSRELVAHLPATTPIGVRLEAKQRRAVMATPLPLYLRIEDRNSMAHGVEVRVPFLDPRLVSYALSLPIAVRMRGPLNKAALRQGLRGRIPDAVQTRVDKMGFPVPARRWFARDLYEPLRDLLDSASARGRGLFKNDALLSELDSARGKELSSDGPFFRAANVETWLTLMAARRAERAPAAKTTVVHDVASPSRRPHFEATGGGGRLTALIREPSPPPA
jgi:asparagine synthase (glutamine-hydrolysing)